MSRNSPETAVRVLNNIRAQNLDISRSAFTAGASVTDYLDAFNVDLFLTTSEEDAQYVIDIGECAPDSWFNFVDSRLRIPPALVRFELAESLHFSFKRRPFP